MLWYNNAWISNDSTLELFTEYYSKKTQNNTDGHCDPTFLNKSSTWHQAPTEKLDVFVCLCVCVSESRADRRLMFDPSILWSEC